MRAMITGFAVALVLALAPAAHAGSAPRFSVPGSGRSTCADAPLRITFGAPPVLGTAGAIEVRDAGGTLADRIDLADPSSAMKSIGGAVSDTGETHRFAYSPVMVSGDTATIHLHHPLGRGRTYRVTVDPGVFTGFGGGTWRFTTARHRPRGRALTVAADGSGDFCTVQAAIDAVPAGNDHPVRIDVRPGTYDEIVYVRPDRPHITVRGSGAARTVIRYANNDRLNGDAALKNGGPADVCPRRVLPTPDLHNCWRALVGVDAADFTLRDLTLRNTTPYGGSQAEAFRGNNARITLDHVRLESYQDTLRLQGTGFVNRSRIEGDVDFVWGTGSVLVQDSTLVSRHAGYVSQIRNDAGHPGDVFLRVRLLREPGVPDGSVPLSRIETNRFPYSQAVFIDTAMDAHITPPGWVITPDDCAQAPDLRFGEYHSTGLDGVPVDTAPRLPCSRQLTAAEAAYWADPAHVLDGWTPAHERNRS